MALGTLRPSTFLLSHPECYKLNGAPHKGMLNSSLPVPWNVTLPGNGAITEGDCGVGWALIQYDSGPQTKRRRYRLEEKRPCEDRGRAWSHAAKSQGSQGFPVAPEATRRTWDRLSPRASRGRGPANTLTADFWSQNYERIVPVLQSHSVCGTLLRWPQVTK